MADLIKYTSTYGDGKTVTYYRPRIANDSVAAERADELNEEEKDSLDAYNASCGDGSAGAVTQEIEEVDG